jgi:hypothetical protein
VKRSYTERIARQTWIVLVFVEVVGAAITLSAVVDSLFALGWGYDWEDVLAGFGIMARLASSG